MYRRGFLSFSSLGLAALSGAALSCYGSRWLNSGSPTPATAHFASPGPLPVIKASAQRIVAVDVGIRPFRPQGPRVELERFGAKQVIHCYGHGGSGWSLSWGAAAAALEFAKASGETNLAVIGCGAIGLTTAVLAQASGFNVRIYTKARMPDTYSSAASGVWTPDSRICAREYATPQFQQMWEAQARFSFGQYQKLSGLPGEPVKWHTGFSLAATNAAGQGALSAHEPEYPDLKQRIPDLLPPPLLLQANEHPFDLEHVRRYRQMGFNINAYSRILMLEFQQAGGEIEIRELRNLDDVQYIREKVMVNATGYGARALVEDASIIPVRGQTAKLIPQPEVNYGISYPSENLFVVPRHDGILVQAQKVDDFGSEDTAVDLALSQAAVARLAKLFI